jgi:GT2 family glycosyltransferase
VKEHKIQPGSRIDRPISRPLPRLSIVIVNFNSWSDVARLVETLGQSPEVQAGECELIIVDNASESDPPARLDATQGWLTLIREPRNRGFAAGVNRGWSRAQGEWLLLLNPDVVTNPDLPGQVLQRIAAYKARPEGVPGIVGFGIRNADRSVQPSVGAEPGLGRVLCEAFLPRKRRKYQNARKIRAGEVPWVTGACALVDPRVLQALGGMDEQFFLYYEEVALAKATRRLGRRVEFDPAIQVTHLRPLQNRQVPSWLRVITRHSMLLYFHKFRPRWEFFGLTLLVGLEARCRFAWAWLRQERSDQRAWQTVLAVAQRMFRGVIPDGLQMYDLARAISQPDSTARTEQIHQPRRQAREAVGAYSGRGSI